MEVLTDLKYLPSISRTGYPHMLTHFARASLSNYSPRIDIHLTIILSPLLCPHSSLPIPLASLMQFSFARHLSPLLCSAI